MYLHVLWHTCVKGSLESRNLVKIPYIAFQKVFQLFVQQLYDIRQDRKNPQPEQVIAENALHHLLTPYFSSGETERCIAGSHINEGGGCIFWGEYKVEKPPKELLYVLLYTQAQQKNGEMEGRPHFHFLLLGETRSEPSSLVVLPLCIIYQTGSGLPASIDCRDEESVSNALSIANQVFLSILANVPVDMTRISNNWPGRRCFVDVAKGRTLETLSDDIRSFLDCPSGATLMPCASDARKPSLPV